MNYSEKVCAWVFVLLVLCLFLAVVTPPLYGEDVQTSPPSEPSTTSESLIQTQQPQGLLQMWSEYDRQFKTSMLNLDQFLDQVEAFGISFESLPGFMTHLVDSYRASELARIQERAASDKAIESERRDAQAARQRATVLTWVAIIAGVFAAAGWGAFGVSAAF